MNYPQFALDSTITHEIDSAGRIKFVAVDSGKLAPDAVLMIHRGREIEAEILIGANRHEEEFDYPPETYGIIHLLKSSMIVQRGGMPGYSIEDCWTGHTIEEVRDLIQNSETPIFGIRWNARVQGDKVICTSDETIGRSDQRIDTDEDHARRTIRGESE